MTELASPLALGRGAELANRLAKAALSERIAGADGAPTEGHLELYRAWARGGAGLIITGNVMIDRNHIGEPGNVVVEDDRDLGGLQAWAGAVHDTRPASQLWMQINHPGRQTPRHLTPRPVAPSAVPMRAKIKGAFAKPRALTRPEIESIIDRFAHTAAIAKAAGFDGVQIHGAHGYLVSQFLSPLTNQREDAWGGTEDKRRRFAIEVLRAVRGAVGKSYPVGMKLNSADFQRGGIEPDASMRVVEALEAEGLDLLEISGGTYEAAAMVGAKRRESSQRREAYFLDYAEQVRTRVKTMPLMVTGGFRTRAGMMEALSEGVDVIGMGRPLCVEPDLPERLFDGATDGAERVDLETGIKEVDAFMQIAWYQRQMHRLASGGRPSSGLGRVAAGLAYFMPQRGFPPIAAVRA